MSRADRDKWDARYAEADRTGYADPSGFLRRMETLLPRAGCALDVAGGSGRNAIWLAARGLDVTIADVSRVGLDVAARRASGAGVVLRTICVDLDEAPLPPGPWDLIVDVLYLSRPLFPAIAAALRPGGVFVFLQPTVTNLERHAKPPRSFLLEIGELERLVPPELEPLVLEEGWSDDGHHEARLVARRR